MQVFSFFLHPLGSICQAWDIWEPSGDGEELAEGEGGRREVSGTQCLWSVGAAVCGVTSELSAGTVV